MGLEPLDPDRARSEIRQLRTGCHSQRGTLSAYSLQDAPKHL